MEPVEINSRNNDSFKDQTRIENIEQQLKTILINLNGDIKPRLENLENFCNPSYLGNRSIVQLEIQEVILPPSVQSAMQMQVEAERKKRSQDERPRERAQAGEIQPQPHRRLTASARRPHPARRAAQVAELCDPAPL